MKMVCPICNKAFHEPMVYRCPDCGEPFELEFEGSFPVEKIRNRKPTLWRYREAIPIERDEDIISFEEGFTPLLEFIIDGHPVWVKQDHLFPSGSYKDRGASVLISYVKSMGIRSVVEDSSGNAGCSIAMYSAAAGIRCEVFVPQVTSPAKLEQVRMLGAGIRKISGSRYETAQAVLEEAKNVYYASHVYNPYFMQGTKTLAYEIVEQMGWKAPERVILPVGNGTLLLGVYNGFKDLLKAGIIGVLPKIIGIQAENCKPLVSAWEQGLSKPVPIVLQPTVAEGIAISQPVLGVRILRAIRETEGFLLAVPEEDILTNWREMATKGFFMELTSATTFAGIKKFFKENPEEIKGKTLSVITGHGLKSVGHF
jgi:threonine synthase